MHVIRKLVGYGATAAGLGLVVALSLAQAAQASVSGAAARGSTPVEASGVLAAPSAQCVAAIQALEAAWKQDAAEDASERGAARANPDMAGDATEDQSEVAAFKPLFAAVRAACSPPSEQSTGSAESTESSEPASATRPAPSAQCTAAVDALKAEIAAIKAQSASEGTTEGTAADLTEDRAEFAQVSTLMKAAAQACGFTPTGTDSFWFGR